jgi:hypothetical protein
MKKIRLLAPAPNMALTVTALMVTALATACGNGGPEKADPAKAPENAEANAKTEDAKAKEQDVAKAAPGEIAEGSPKATLKALKAAVEKKDAKAVEALVMGQNPEFQKAYAGVLMGGLRAAELWQKIEARKLTNKVGLAGHMLQAQAKTVDTTYLQSLLDEGEEKITGNRATVGVEKVVGKRKTRTKIALFREGETWKMGVSETSMPSVLTVSKTLPALYDGIDAALKNEDDEKAAEAINKAYEKFQGKVKPEMDDSIPPFPKRPYANPKVVAEAAYIAKRLNDPEKFLSCYTDEAIGAHFKRAVREIHMAVRINQRSALGKGGFVPGLIKKYGLKVKDFEKAPREKEEAFQARIGEKVKGEKQRAFVMDYFQAKNKHREKVQGVLAGAPPEVSESKKQGDYVQAQTTGWDRVANVKFNTKTPPRKDTIKFRFINQDWYIDNDVGL